MGEGEKGEGNFKTVYKHYMLNSPGAHCVLSNICFCSKKVCQMEKGSTMSTKVKRELWVQKIAIKSFTFCWNDLYDSRDFFKTKNSVKVKEEFWGKKLEQKTNFGNWFQFVEVLTRALKTLTTQSDLGWEMAPCSQLLTLQALEIQIR